MSTHLASTHRSAANLTAPAGHLRHRHHRFSRLGRALVSGAAVVALLLVGCSNGDGASVATATPTATDTGVPTATPFPTGTGAPSTATSDPTSTAEPTGTAADGEPTADDAVAVLDAYFTAIGTGDYETAYQLWRNDGEASGQTFDEFVDGFAETASISWEIGEPGRIDPGAGQRYIEIPVRVVARTTDGAPQEFEGAYVLHQTADIEGATPEQRVWRIHSAEMVEVE